MTFDIKIVEVIGVVVCFAYIFNPYIAKHAFLIETVTVKLNQLILLCIAYGITIYVSPILGILIALAIAFIQFDFHIS